MLIIVSKVSYVYTESCIIFDCGFISYLINSVGPNRILLYSLL